MSIVLTLKAKDGIFDIKEFCRLKGITYVGRFANKETSKVIQGTIIKYNGKFYTNEKFLRAGGVSFSPADDEGMVTISVRLFETDYVPEECKPLDDCPIRIDIWDTTIDDEGPIGAYAFYENQIEEAKEVVNSNEDVDIFRDGVKLDREEFLAS